MQYTGTVRSLNLLHQGADPRQAFTLVLPDGGEVKAESPAAASLQEGDHATLTGDLDTEGVLQVTSVQRLSPPPVPQLPVPAPRPLLSFGRVFVSALLSVLLSACLLTAVYVTAKNQPGDSTPVVVFIVGLLVCPVLGPALSLVFARLLGGSLKTGRVWLAPLVSLLLVLLGYFVLIASAGKHTR